MSCSVAQSVGSKADESELLRLERSAWDLYQAKDVKGLTALTVPEFYDIYSDGMVVHRKQWLDDMMKFDVHDSKLTNFDVIWLTPDSAIIVYEAVAHATAEGKEVSIHNAVTSAWARRKGKWLNVFYKENVLNSPAR